MNRKRYAELIVETMRSSQSIFREEFFQEGRIKSFIVDNLLPDDLAHEIYNAFPNKKEMVFKNDFRERKYVAAQMNCYRPILEEIIFAFQDPHVVRIVSEITGIPNLIPDENLYAGGISLMCCGDYLNPHIDNSHDHERKNYRALNLLYYVTPGWETSYGGHLELWDHGVMQSPRTIESKFNKLVVMITGKSSWHSVSKVLCQGERRCVSNYYFSPHSVDGEDYFHVTSFRGRPEQKFSDSVLRFDSIIRNGIRKIFKKGVVRTSHIYRK